MLLSTEDFSGFDAFLPHGWMSHEELSILARLSLRTGMIPGNILEVGTFMGRSTFAFLQGDGLVFCVDTWQGENISDAERPWDMFADFRATMKRLGLWERIIPLVGRSHTILSALLGPFRLILIDADHSYASAKTDLDLCLPLLDPRGFIVMDDVNQPDVARVVAESEYRVLWERPEGTKIAVGRLRDSQ